MPFEPYISNNDITLDEARRCCRFSETDSTSLANTNEFTSWADFQQRQISSKNEVGESFSSICLFIFVVREKIDRLFEGFWIFLRNK